MKIGSILILMVVTMGLLAVPAAATYEIQNGTLGYTLGVTQDIKTYITSGSPHGYQSVNGLHFKKIEEYPTFGALKLFAQYKDDFIRYNTTSNDSYTSASLQGPAGKVSDGIFGYSRNSWTGDWYIYYFANTWDITGLTGDQFLSLHYDNSLFDITGNYIPDPFTSNLDLGFSKNLFSETAAGYDAGGYNSYSMVEYTDQFYNKWYLYKDTPSDLYNRIYIAKVFDFNYPSQIIVNITVGGMNQTVFNKYSNTDEFIDGLHPSNFPYYIDFIAKGGTVHQSVRLDAPAAPGAATWDLIVIVRDASTSGLYDGATVTKTDLTDPYYNGWGTTYSGRVTFQAITGHEYNFSASAVGYTTGYANYSAITPINPYVSIWIYPIGTPATGYGYLDFMVRDSVGNTLEQAQVHLTDGQTKYTLMGYTRFNVTASTVIGYSVMKENYNTVTGNITSTAGTLTIPIILYNTGEGPTPTPTLDRRTSQQKFIDAGAVFANNAELFASLIVMAVMISLIDKVTLGSLSRAFGGRRKGK